MDIAYSIEFNDVIDAEKAYDLFQAGVIKDKRAFECPDEDCTAQITCVNIDKPIQETKKSVHFRSYGSHRENCSYGHKKATTNSTSDEIKSESNKISNIHILTERPKDYYTIREAKNLSLVERNREKKDRKRHYHQSGESKSPKKHYWIAPLVSTYLNAKSEKNVLNKTFLRKGNIEISFSDFFVNISGQEFKALSKYPRVYYAKAFFNAKKEDEIEIKFASSFRLEGELKKPALRLDLKAVSEYKNYSYWKNRLEIAIDSKRPYLFFIYGVPNIEVWDKDDEQIKFLRFKTKKFDYMDLRV